MPVHILVINHYANLPSYAGSTRHYSFAKELVRRGHRVTIVASSFNHKGRFETRQWPPGDMYQIETVDGIRFVWVKTPPYSGNTAARIINMVSFARKLLRLPKDAFGFVPDVVYASSPHLFATLSAHRMARRLRVPFVLEIRDLWPESLVALGDISRQHPFILLLGAMERYLYRKADHIITLLPLAGDHMIAKGAAPEKITWISNGIDLTMLQDVPEPASASPLVGVYAGTHGLANGLDLLLDAAGILQADGFGQSFLFRFVGDGPHKSSLIKRAKDLGLVNVTFEDAVPKTEVYRVLAEADFFPVVLRDSPLYQWGISLNKLFDYMAMGRPIVFSGKAPANPVEASRSGIITKPGDAVDFANGIRRLSQMSIAERDDLGRRGRQYVEKHFAIPVLVDRLEAVFEFGRVNRVRRLS